MSRKTSSAGLPPAKATPSTGSSKISSKNETSPPIEIRSYIILDLETTGLPSTHYGETKITELSLLAVMKSHFSDTDPFKIPRVQNKLTVCFHPRRHIDTGAERVTGLNNEMLEEQGSFDERFCDILTNFINRAPPPVCLLAHNGNRFDFPLLQAHTKILHKPLPEGLLCADTLLAFRELKVVEKDLPWKIPEKVTHPYTPPTPDPNDVIFAPRGSTTSANEDLWPKMTREEEASLSSSDIIKIIEEIEKSNAATRRELGEKTLNQFYGGTPKRSLPVPLPPVAKRHSVPGPETMTPNVAARRQLVFAPKGDRPKYNLDAVYRHLFNQPVPRAHSAEGDTEALMKIIAVLGSPFHEWVEKNCRRLSSILKMW
ncbi:three prime repair exonuclease [Nesidiocoris tenuis]|uniref:Three prime repair exonuclease n=1 Tax=Nesidiocoris tenuis TaxID=355587 RepID=A0ABN7B7W8_9HEMI|nr:three prime repair exonuclease [Nesidiocoris tenuis]